MKECVFEIYGEEIPARFQGQAVEQLEMLFLKNSAKNNVNTQGCTTYVTPQRLIIHAYIAKEIPEQTVEKRGPRVSAPDKALQGFCISAGVTLNQVVEKDGYYCVSFTKPRQTVEEILPTLLDAVILQMQWPKTMRWPQTPTPWVRPVRHLFALLDGNPFECFIPSFNLFTQGYTFGHRYLSLEKIYPTSFSDYQEKLGHARVIICTEERKRLILKSLEKEASGHNVTLILDKGLLEENAGLVEYPGVFIGKLPPNLFKAPEEAIITSMRFHQKCFAFRGSDGKLAPFFAAIINTIPKDGGKALTQGYEMGMLKARLEDACYFYERDLKIPLADYQPKLDTIIFHEKLGTVGDKIRRLHKVKEAYEKALGLKNEEFLSRAVDLCKSDLLTQIVGEFAELQGIIGEIYARAQGEPEDVAIALREHYQPLGVSDDIPMLPLSYTLALMDKLDTLTGFVGHGILPTGSRDPFALRRAALGVIRIILDNQLTVSLKALITATHRSYGTLSSPVIQDLLAFFYTRAEFYFKEQGFSYGVIRACMPPMCEGGDLYLSAMHSKMRALQSLVITPMGKALLAGYKRAANIFSVESAKDKGLEYNFDENLLVLHAEKSLHVALQNVDSCWEKAPSEIEKCDLLISLKSPIDSFFEHVMVNDANPFMRNNRLGFLQTLLSRFHRFADFSFMD